MKSFLVGFVIMLGVAWVISGIATVLFWANTGEMDWWGWILLSSIFVLAIAGFIHACYSIGESIRNGD